MPLFSRSARTLIKQQRGEQRHIKVLQTLGCAAMQAAIDIKVLQTLGMARETRSVARSAGACPPRSLDLCGKRRQPRDTDGCCSARCMARDRPSPYGEKGRFLRCYRSAGACPPRSLTLGMARDRPSPYVKGRRFFHRSAGPSDAIRASERVSLQR